MMILDTEIDLVSNKYLVFKRHLLLFTIFLVSACLDAASTTHFMRIIGTGAEMNVPVRLLSDLCGMVVGPIIGKSWQVLAFWLLSAVVPRLTRFVGTILIVVNLYAAWYNFQT